MRPYSFALLLWGLFLPAHFFAQAQIGTESIFRTLQKYEPLNITIETDLKQLKSEKTDETWQPAIFQVLQGDSAVLRFNVQVAARGNMRKKTCDFPPIKIKFYADETANDSIADVNELKLVTSCHKTEQNEEWVRKELVVYQLYNLLADQSFRVKQANVKITSPDKKSSPVESFAFFIENEKELAARLGGKPIKPKIVSLKIMDTTAYDRACLFQYMIGNTDWSIRVRHNVKVIYFSGRNKAAPIPYDFDYCGLVGTNYAAPSPEIPIQTVKERYFMGPCRSAAHYQQVFDFFLSKKQAMLDHIEQSDFLAKDSKKQMDNYLDEFFQVIEKPATAKREIIQNCNKSN